jgi:hypothetical protein
MTAEESSLDYSRLEKLRHVGGKITARCPACAEVGGDRTGSHLVIFPSGKFACAAMQGDRGHSRRIFALVGIARERSFDPDAVRIWRQRQALEHSKAREGRRAIAAAKKYRDAIIARHSWKPADVWEDSPQRIDSDLVESDPRHFLAALFPEDATLWTGRVFQSGEGHASRWRTCSELMAEEDDELIGPMVTPSTWIQGKSSRTRENVLTTPYVVMDFDGIDGVKPVTAAEHEELALNSLALIRWFREGLRWKLAAILKTGSKSLHAWFHKPPQEMLSTLKPLASTLGMDAGLICGPEHPCRLPGQRHEKTGNYSTVLWLQLPEAS